METPELLSQRSPAAAEEAALARVSKGAKKRSMEQLQQLGKQLVDLPAGKFQKVAIPEKLREAVTEARRLTSMGAKRRQIQYIGRIMDEFDAAAIVRNLRLLDHHTNTATASASGLNALDTNPSDNANQRRQTGENQWVGLIQSDDQTLHTRYSERLSTEDFQFLRQILRNARKELKVGQDSSGAIKKLVHSLNARKIRL